jgi:hypothetical protein
MNYSLFRRLYICIILLKNKNRRGNHEKETVDRVDFGCFSFPKGFCKKQTYTPNSSLDATKDVTLKVVGDTKTFAALEAVGNDFTAVYPHAHISYEYVQDYSN